MLTTPVALVVFRRPDHTRRVLEAIRRARPKTLLIIADGPSAERPAEAAQCAAARAVVDELVDWDCQLLKNYSDVNLGVEQRFSTGFDWLFEQCEEAIILEDDELPNDSFFSFCHEMLDRYRHDDRVMAINGTNHLLGSYAPPESYYFSKYFHCWGIATWRRFWKLYDVKIRRWPELRETRWLLDLSDGNAAEAAYHQRNFDRLLRGEVQTWDYQVSFALWAHGGLAITPAVNLVSNIGFGEGALHCQSADNPFANAPTSELIPPLSHPPTVSRDTEADRVEYERVIGDWLRSQNPEKQSFLRRAWAKLRQP